MGESVPGVLFEYERISDTILDFGLGVSLKIVADLGFKDKDERKNRVYNEYQYHSSKYRNTDTLISAVRNAKFFLRLDYPNIDNNSIIKKNNIIINAYAIFGLRDIIKEFDKHVFDPYKRINDEEVSIIANQVKIVRSFPIKGSMISFSHEIFETKDGKMDYGVKMVLNDDYQIIMRTTTTWKAFVYYIMTCDLYMWGSQLITPYINKLVGNAVSSMGEYSVSRRYNSEISYEPDPNEIAEANNIKVKNKDTKPLTKKDKLRSFFDD